MKFYADGWALSFDRVTGFIVTEETPIAGARPEVDDFDVSIPGFNGALHVQNLRFGPAPYSLHIIAVGSDHADALDRVALLHRIFQPGRLVTLRRETPGRDVSTAAKVMAAVEPDRVGRETASIGLGFVFKIPAGRWFDTAETRAVLAVGTHTAPALTGGSAPMSPLLEIVGNGPTTDVRVTDVPSGDWVRVRGNLAAGAVATVDPVKGSCTVEGSPRLDLLDWGADPMYISPEARLTLTQNGVQQCVVRARRAFFE